jgi:aryl-alcohol dehydrogenase-like predicted oxidoreductase
MFDRRQVLWGSAALAAAVAGGYWMISPRRRESAPAAPVAAMQVKNMPYRKFGRTGLNVSEVGFGAWGIGGQVYGKADRNESLAALAKAEELGCNFVDTAAVYGDSETVLGEFLTGRRDRWIVATKYSGQAEGMKATLESQLARLRTDHVDFYMIHWMPGRGEQSLFEELERLKKSGKVRFAGVSLYSREDIASAIGNALLDGFMIAVNLLEPDPFMAMRADIAASGKAVIVRSTLKEGFLAGKFTKDTRFTDPADQRSKWSAEKIAETVDHAERFRFLEHSAGSLARGAIAYPLSFPEVSAVVVGVKKVWEAEEDFGKTAGLRLSSEELDRISRLQSDLGLRKRVGLIRRLRGLLR